MKKKLLFVIDSLGSGGAEKSLVTLLSMIDYDKYEVDLQLFSMGGVFEQFLSDQVKVLPKLEYFTFASRSIVSQVLSCDVKKLIARVLYSLSLRRKNLTHTDRAMFFWQNASECFAKPRKRYDVVIAYGQGVPTFYVADKITADKKVAWVNASLMFSGRVKQYNQEYYLKFDLIVPVSNSAKEILANNFPTLKPKMNVVKDILDENFIKLMANKEKSLEIKCDLPVLLTVARLNNRHKGYDITLEVCRILHNRGVAFRWYAIGEGPYRHEMERYIAEHGLQDTFILLGTKANPYPYFKACDLYVQTSRHEGFGLSIAEARILNKPVVTTEFDAVWNQMVQGKNGVVVPQNPEAVADAIEDLLKHPEKMKAISDYQKSEKKSNKEELEKFYQLIDGEK